MEQLRTPRRGDAVTRAGGRRAGEARLDDVTATGRLFSFLFAAVGAGLLALAPASSGTERAGLLALGVMGLVAGAGSLRLPWMALPRPVRAWLFVPPVLTEYAAAVLVPGHAFATAVLLCFMAVWLPFGFPRRTVVAATVVLLPAIPLSQRASAGDAVGLATLSAGLLLMLVGLGSSIYWLRDQLDAARELARRAATEAEAIGRTVQRVVSGVEAANGAVAAITSSMAELREQGVALDGAVADQHGVVEAIAEAVDGTAAEVARVTGAAAALDAVVTGSGVGDGAAAGGAAAPAARSGTPVAVGGGSSLP